MLKLNGKEVLKFKCRMCGEWYDINKPELYLPNYTNEENAASSGFCCEKHENQFFNMPSFTRVGSEREVWLKDGSIVTVWECSAPKFNWEFSKSFEARRLQVEEYKRDPEAYLKKQEKKRIAEDADPKLQEHRIKQEFSDRREKIQSSIDYYKKEIEKYESTISYESSMNFYNSKGKISAAREGIKRSKLSLEEAKKKLSDLRVEEYWTFHQEKKKKLESEKKSLKEQISVLNKEISKIPKEAEGYTDMIEFQKKTQELTAEKKALGFFKFKDKKAIQTQIDSINDKIAKIQDRINSAINEVKKRISSLETRIKEIDNELTNPR